MTHVHFVGFREDREFLAAVRVFGQPDFIHKIHDHRAYGDIDEDNDIVVLASRASLTPSRWTWQDHELW